MRRLLRAPRCYTDRCRVYLLCAAIALVVPGIGSTAATTADELRQQLLRLKKAGNHAAAVRLYEELRLLAPEDSTVVHGFARTLAAVKSHDRIVSLLKPYLRDHPDDIQAYLLLGQGHQRLGQIERALKAWRQALKRAPQRLQLYLDISNRCRATGLYQAAIQILVDGRATLEQDRLFSRELAALYLLNEEYFRAVTSYLDYLEQEPRRFASIEHRLLAVARDAARAPGLVQALKDARKNAGDPLQVSLLLSSCALEAGDPWTGYQVLSEIVDIPEVAPILFQFASRCQDRGYDATAIQAYALFVEHSQDSPYLFRALLRQAEIHMHRENYQQAMETYSQLAQQFPARPEAREALFHLGRLQLQVLGDVQGARTSLQAVLQLARRGPWASESLALLAECALQQDDLEQATAHLHQLEQQDSGSAQLARYGLAELAYFQNDFDAAAKFLNALLEDDPRHELANDALELSMLLAHPQTRPEALSALARAQLRERQKRPREAVEHWEWLAAYAPPALRQLSLLSRARILEERQELVAALVLYGDLVEHHPQSRYAIEAQIGRARLYEQQNRIDQALKAYETALLDFPDDVRAPGIRLQIQRLRQVHQEGKEG